MTDEHSDRETQRTDEDSGIVSRIKNMFDRD
ncbi:hypothetical protein C482_09952 [Natrialba chahannaoensis JCM 10990]|uniref:Uncharacterized protein n=1 Tax=Natrialba chahannaoensis JCM 10990 TaxID=1227492 RepID=M0AM52_9EURY|nr:hypothetical protein C482_09952 [Natrialba chahannaoensis JCM 10990]